MIVVDTGAWYAVFDSAEPAHTACTEFLATGTEALVTTPLVLAERVSVRGGGKVGVHCCGEVSDGGVGELAGRSGDRPRGEDRVRERSTTAAVGQSCRVRGTRKAGTSPVAARSRIGATRPWLGLYLSAVTTTLRRALAEATLAQVIIHEDGHRYTQHHARRRALLAALAARRGEPAPEAQPTSLAGNRGHQPD